MGGQPGGALVASAVLVGVRPYGRQPGVQQAAPSELRWVGWQYHAFACKVHCIFAERWKSPILNIDIAHFLSSARLFCYTPPCLCR